LGESVGKFFSEFYPSHVCRDGIWSKGARPKLAGTLVGQILMKIRGFYLIPGIQKHHIKEKQLGALEKCRAKKLLW